MGDHDEAHAGLCLELHQQIEDLLLDRHVERGGRLVGDQQFRIAGDRHRDHHALALATRHLVREVVQPFGWIRQTDELEELDRTLAPGLSAEAHVDAQHFFDLEADGEARIEACHRLLEDHGNVLADQLAPLGGRDALDVTALEQHLVGGNLRRPGEQTHDGEHGHGLARAALADDCEHLAGLHRQRHAVDGLEPAGGRLELDGQVFDFEKRHVRTS